MRRPPAVARQRCCLRCRIRLRPATPRVTARAAAPGSSRPPSWSSIAAAKDGAASAETLRDVNDGLHDRGGHQRDQRDAQNGEGDVQHLQPGRITTVTSTSGRTRSSLTNRNASVFRATDDISATRCRIRHAVDGSGGRIHGYSRPGRHPHPDSAAGPLAAGRLENVLIAPGHGMANKCQTASPSVDIRTRQGGRAARPRSSGPGVSPHGGTDTPGAVAQVRGPSRIAGLGLIPLSALANVGYPAVL